MLAFSAVFGYGLQMLLEKKKAAEFHSKFKAYRYFIILSTKSRGLIFGLLLPALVITYWNLPWNLDASVTSLQMHLADYLSYMLAGVMVGFSITYIPRKLRVALLWISFMQMGMMGSMMLVWQPGFYSAFSAAQNQQLNTLMMLLGAGGVTVTSVYLLREMELI